MVFDTCTAEFLELFAPDGLGYFTLTRGGIRLGRSGRI